MNRPEDGNNISIDPNGDRTLIVGTGENQKFFRVSSKAMSLASPVWKAMFTGPYRESTAEEISFPEAEPNALLIALRIAHLQFKDLPSSLDFQGFSISLLSANYTTWSRLSARFQQIGLAL